MVRSFFSSSRRMNGLKNVSSPCRGPPVMTSTSPGAQAHRLALLLGQARPVFLLTTPGRAPCRWGHGSRRPERSAARARLVWTCSAAR